MGVDVEHAGHGKGEERAVDFAGGEAEDAGHGAEGNVVAGTLHKIASPLPPMCLYVHVPSQRSDLALLIFELVF